MTVFVRGVEVRVVSLSSYGVWDGGGVWGGGGGMGEAGLYGTGWDHRSMTER